MDRERKRKIDIKAAIHDEFNSNVVLDGRKYLVVTENEGAETPRIITRVYLKGAIVLVKKAESRGAAYAHKNINEFMRTEHQVVMKSLKEQAQTEAAAVAAAAGAAASASAETTETVKARSHNSYLKEMRGLLLKKENAKALDLIEEAIKVHPGEPFVLSHYGTLKATVQKDFTGGIDYCKKAIKALNRKVPFGHEFYYPSLYLNLGRAYAASGNKKNAVNIFRKGIALDGTNHELIKELEMLGTRRKPVVPWLDRDNLINKNLGRLFYKVARPQPTYCI